MAGGIFIDQPFSFNMKCVVFGLVLALLYWFLPRRNYIILFFIFILSYIILAWYDHFYECKYDKLYSGYNIIGPAVIDSIFKPQPIRNELKDQEKIYLRNVYIFHTFIIAPFLIYVGYKNKGNIFKIILILGIIALLYHGFRLAHNL